MGLLFDETGFDETGNDRYPDARRHPRIALSAHLASLNRARRDGDQHLRAIKKILAAHPELASLVPHYNPTLRLIVDNTLARNRRYLPQFSDDDGPTAA